METGKILSGNLQEIVLAAFEYRKNVPSIGG